MEHYLAQVVLCGRCAVAEVVVAAVAVPGYRPEIMPPVHGVRVVVVVEEEPPLVPEVVEGLVGMVQSL